MGANTGIPSFLNYAGAADNKARVQLLIDQVVSVYFGTSHLARIGFLDRASPIGMVAVLRELTVMQENVAGVGGTPPPPPPPPPGAITITGQYADANLGQTNYNSLPAISPVGSTVTFTAQNLADLAAYGFVHAGNGRITSSGVQ